MRRRLTKRVAISIALLLLLLLLVYTAYKLQKADAAKALTVPLAGLAFHASSMVFMASFWPTDATLQPGWGRRCVALLHGALAAVIANEVRKTWDLAKLYPLDGQTVLHYSSLTTFFGLIFNNFVYATLGIITWGLIRFAIAGHASIAILTLIGMHILEGGGFRRPTHACYLPHCLAHGSVLEAWVSDGLYALGCVVIAITCTQENRKAIARRTGLVHVPLSLEEINVRHARRLYQEVAGAAKKRDVTFGIPLVKACSSSENSSAASASWS